MGYTRITTTITKEGKEDVTLNTVSTEDEPLKLLVSKHNLYVNNWIHAQREEHPLEEVFAKVKDPFRSVVKNNPGVKAEYAFRLVVGSPPSLDNVQAAVGWCVVTMGKKGQYPKLDDCLAAAIEQATKGKGQRHGGDKTPFLGQPWVRLYKTHGLGFLLGQADKKYHEALGKEKEDDMVREILGAIVYLGMALLVLEGKVK